MASSQRLLMTRLALLCYDGSTAAAQAIDRAAELFPGSEALVLSVAIPAKDELPLDPIGDVVGRLSGFYREWDEVAAELAERQAASGCQLAAEAGLRARPLTAVGKPASTIVRVADEHDVAVIVVGAGDHTALGGLLGDVAARVVQHAHCPVLVVPPKPQR